MTILQPIADAGDRVLAALVSGLEFEFGRGAGAALAQRFLEAEEVEFTWAARQRERWLGSYEGSGEDDFELERIQILGRLAGRWFVAVMIVDGEGNAHGMMGRRTFADRRRAAQAFGNG